MPVGTGGSPLDLLQAPQVSLRDAHCGNIFYLGSEVDDNDSSKHRTIHSFIHSWSLQATSRGQVHGKVESKNLCSHGT